MLHMIPRFSLFDVVSRNPAIDLHLLEACAERTAGGCLFLSPPADWQAALSRDLGELADALPALRKLAGHLVLDFPCHLDRHLVRIIDQCDDLLLVFEPTLAGVAAARQKLDLLAELEFDVEKVILVVNRCSRKSRKVEQKLADCFPAFKMINLPNDFELCQQALVLGIPAVEAGKRAPLTRAVELLAQEVRTKR
jgi:Flp pilus assembly CpaE family ATPase